MVKTLTGLGPKWVTTGDTDTIASACSECLGESPQMRRLARAFAAIYRKYDVVKSLENCLLL